jgi:hypothetical protein
MFLSLAPSFVEETNMATRLPSQVRPYVRSLIEKATAECENEEDQHISLLTAIENEVPCPFRARAAGEEVEVISYEWPTTGYGLSAVCRAGAQEKVVDINVLQWLDPRPDGYEWIEAYRAWRQGLE